MKQGNRHRLPLFWRLTFTITAAWLVLLTATLGLTMHFSMRTMANKIDNILMSTVESLGHAPHIQRAVKQGCCDQEMREYLTSVVENTEDLEFITIADRNSVRLFFIDPAEIGQTFLGDDQYRALAGEVYLSTADPANYGTQRRAFHPVWDEAGEVIGFVMASATHNRIREIQGKIIVSYIGIAAMLSACTLVLSGILAVYLGKNLRGMRLEDVVRAYLSQNDILNTLDNGLISFDNTGSVRLVNTAAARMLGHREDLLVGRNVDELLRAADGSSLRNRTEGKLGVQSSRPNILVRPVQIPNAALWARQVLILSDKSEVTQYAEALVGTQHMVSTLRANTHEFLNKLQVISGLLQMGQTEEAQRYIGSIAAAYEHITGPVLKLIRNTNVAALILGKSSRMRELDIDLVMVSESDLPERSRFLSTTELLTVLGNLLENAIEATNASPAEELRASSLQIKEDEKGLLIIVSDTGEGIEPENLPRIYEKGFSTKANAGRGLGMGRIRDIVESHEGTIEVDTEPGSGTTFTIIISRERGGSL